MEKPKANMTEESPDVKAEDLQLDDVVGMEPADLTDTHREYLEQNKSYLTADQQAKFFGGADGGGEGDKKEESEDGKSDDDKKDEYNPDTVEPGVKKAIAFDLGSDDDEDDDMDAEDRARINKQVAKGSKSIIERQQLTEDTQAVNNIVNDNPELKPYKTLALKYMKAHPSLVAEDAMKIASAGDQQRIGARREREAAEKAKRTQSGGSTQRTGSTQSKDWSTATPAEMELQIARAKGQRV